jgi:hypothetical protein
MRGKQLAPAGPVLICKRVLPSRAVCMQHAFRSPRRPTAAGGRIAHLGRIVETNSAFVMMIQVQLQAQVQCNRYGGSAAVAARAVLEVKIGQKLDNYRGYAIQDAKQMATGTIGMDNTSCREGEKLGQEMKIG